MHRVKNSRSGQGIAVPFDLEVSVIIRHAYASGYGNWNGNWYGNWYGNWHGNWYGKWDGNWYGNSNLIMFEEFKTEALQYRLTYKDYGVR